MDKNFARCSDTSLQWLATVFPQAIASINFPDHRLALIGYLDHCGLVHEQDGDKVVVRENGDLVLTATFDNLSRLTNLEVLLHAPAGGTPSIHEYCAGLSSPSESWEQMQLRLMRGG